MHANYDDMVQLYNSADIAHAVAPLTEHPVPVSCQPPPHINSVNHYTTLCTQKPDIADNATGCFSNETHPSIEDSTQVTNKEEWTDSNDDNLDASKHTINTTRDVLDATSF
jgi:hypothetical protein